MTPTPELIIRLRRFLGERIPSDGTESNTRFTDDELKDLIEESQTIYGAASIGWMEKASMVQEEMGNVEETRTGQETYKFTQLKDRLAYAQMMAKSYQDREDADLKSKSGKSYMFNVARPEVL